MVTPVSDTRQEATPRTDLYWLLPMLRARGKALRSLGVKFDEQLAGTPTPDGVASLAHAAFDAFDVEVERLCDLRIYWRELLGSHRAVKP